MAKGLDKSKLKNFKEIEAVLEKKYGGAANNVVRLSENDFSGGKLSIEGYARLKEESKYIDKKAEPEIAVPKQYEAGFKDNLEFLAARELKMIKHKNDMATIQSVVLLFIGALFFSLGYIEVLKQFAKEITVIASWVFIWAAVEKMFFDPLELRIKKFIILRTVSAKITCETEPENKIEEI